MPAKLLRLTAALAAGLRLSRTKHAGHSVYVVKDNSVGYGKPRHRTVATVEEMTPNEEVVAHVAAVVRRAPESDPE